MPTLPYDEDRLLDRLRRLPAQLRVAFSLLCAFRLLPEYERFHEQTGWGDSAALRRMADQLWRDTLGEQMTVEEVQGFADRCMELVPTEEDSDDATQPFAEDAAVAVALALGVRLRKDAREAAWAGRRIYNAVETFVGAADSELPRGDSPIVTRERLRAIEAHPLVQAEIDRQCRDLDDLEEVAERGVGEDALGRLRIRSEQDARRLFTAVK